MIPPERPTFSDICLELTTSIARRSTCNRLSVGAVITSFDHRQVLSWGYNGNATGLANCCDTTEPGNCGCLHAEINAIINCNAPRSIEKYVYLTDSPCRMCAKAIINLGGVQEVIFRRPYRDQSPVDLLLGAGITWRCVP